MKMEEVKRLPKAKCKKKTAFQSVQVKSVFLYGNPNKGKQDILSRMERQFTEQVNRDIALLLDQVHVLPCN